MEASYLAKQVETYMMKVNEHKPLISRAFIALFNLGKSPQCNKHLTVELKLL